MTSSSIVVAVCFHIVFCVCSSSENRPYRDNIYFRRLNELVLPGVDTSDIFCGSSSMHREQEAEIVELVNAGYRFFDLAVYEVHAELHWSLTPFNNMASRSRGREITRDLQLLAASASQRNSELFVLRFSLDEVTNDGKIPTAGASYKLPGNRDRAASGFRLLRAVLREFGARLVRSSLLTKEGVTVGNILSSGGNVAVFVKNLNDFQPPDDDVECCNSSSGRLPLLEFFLPDDVIVTVGPSMYELTDGDTGVEDVVLETYRAVSGLSHVILRLTDSSDDTRRQTAGKFSACLRLVFTWVPLCAMFVILIVIPLNWRLSTCCRLPYVTCTVLHLAHQMSPAAITSDFRRARRPLVGRSTVFCNTNEKCRWRFAFVKKLISGLGAAMILTGLICLAASALEDDTSSSNSSSSMAPDCPSQSLLATISHWLARPGFYHINILRTIRSKSSSDRCRVRCTSERNANNSVPRLAALANEGRIRRQVSLRHAGSPLTGATGFRSLFVCPPVVFAYVVMSPDEGHVVAWNQLTEGESRDFEEGDFPMDSNIIVYVDTVWNRWLQIYSVNLQRLIESGRDVYLRGTESRGGIGLAYVSHQRRHLSSSCRTVPTSGLLNVAHWDDRVGVEQQQTVTSSDR